MCAIGGCFIPMGQSQKVMYRNASARFSQRQRELE
jgi:hypothetical protein